MVKISDSISVRKIENEIFIFDRKTSKVHSLNNVASCIWEQLTENKAPEEITDTICARFDVNKETAEKDILELFNELEAKKLVTFS